MEINKTQQNSTEATLESGLTPIQEQAAIMLASGDSTTSVSERLNLNRSTIYQWQKKITFQCFLNFQRKEAKETLKNGLLGLYNDALKAVKQSLSSDNESIKLKTAMWIIAKVEKNPIGNTDAREVLRKQATQTECLLPDWEVEKEVFNEIEYQKLLDENGLK